MRRWVEIQPEHIFELFDKAWITRDLEGLHKVRFEAVLFPSSANAGFTVAAVRRHRARAPVGGVFRLRLGRQTHDLCIINRLAAPATRGILANGLQAAFGVVHAPPA